MNIRRNEKAVSPVSATILMVAITVVLAAVLYVMVSGLIGTGTTGTPNVEMTTESTTDGYEFEFAKPSRSEALSSYKVNVMKNGVAWSVMPVLLSDGMTIENTGGAGEWLNFTDALGEGDLTAGDFFTLEELASGSEYEVAIFWASSNDKITSVTVNVS